MTESVEQLKEKLEKLKNDLKDKRQKVVDKTLEECISDVNPLPKTQIKCRRELRGHFAKVYAFDWDKSSNQTIVSASQDGKLILWNTVTALKTTAIPLKSSWVMTVAFSPDGKLVACGGLDNMVTVYDLCGSQSQPRIKREFAFHQGYISSVVFTDENQLVSASGDGKCVLWDVEANKKIKVMEGHSSDVMKVSLKPGTNNIFASGSCDNTCRIWDTKLEHSCVQIFDNHEEDINCVAFHPNGCAVASASDDGTARIFDLTADNQLSKMTFETNNNKMGCTGCTFSLSGRLLFVAQEDFVVSIRDSLRGDCLGKLTGYENRISSLAVSPDGMALCTASWDNLLRIYA